jgi:membrane-bound serine protease (ClpP class)
MWMILAVTIAGFGLIAIDVLLIPGAVIAALGCGLLLYGSYLTYVDIHPVAGLLYFTACLIMVPRMLIWGLGRVSLKEEFKKEEGWVGVEDHQDLIGMEGVALSDCRPAGAVKLDEKAASERWDCVAEGGYIEKGDRVKVIDSNGPSLVIRKQA